MSVVKGKQGFLYAMSMVVGCIIGSGIFKSVGSTFKVFDGSMGLTLLIWFICGVLAMCCAFSYCELGTAISKSGGERVYFDAVFGPKVARIFVVSIYFLIKPMTIAWLLKVSADHATKIGIFLCDNVTSPKFVMFFFLILSLVILNIVKPSLSQKFQIAFMVEKIITIFIIIITGFVFMAKGVNKPIFDNFYKFNQVNVNSLFPAMVEAFWSLEGWNMANFIIQDLANPKKDLTLGLIGGTLLCVVLYCLCVLSYGVVLGYDVASNAKNIAMSLAITAFPKGAFIIPLCIVLSTIGSANGQLLCTATLAQSAALENHFPKIFSLETKNEKSPTFAILVAAFMTIIFSFLDVGILLDYISFLSWIFYSLSMVCVIYIRYKLKHIKPSIRVPLICPIVGFLTSLAVIIQCFIQFHYKAAIILFFIIIIYPIQLLPKKYYNNRFFNKINCMYLVFSHFSDFLEMIFIGYFNLNYPKAD